MRSALNSHGDSGYRVTQYDLDLDYKIMPNRLSGRAKIAAAAARPLAKFGLDLSGFKVTGVQVDGRAAKFSRSGSKLTVKPARPVVGPFTVEVRYSGNPKPVGGRWGDIGWDELTDGVLVASQPIGAPSWFPCNDRPADKAAYRVTVTTSSGYAVLVTGDLVSRSAGASTTKWVYERREPTSTYLMSVQIGRYEEVVLAESQRLAVPRALLPLARHDFARQPEMAALFSRLFGPYPFGDYVAVVVADELEDPVEAQGMAIFGRNHVDGRRTAERLVAHELAHQWFGNSLTIVDWPQIWLNEGFATYAEWLWSDASGGPSVGELAARWRARLETLPQDLVIADPGEANLFDERVYKRGALTVHTLRREVGEEIFFALLRSWVAAHRHGTVTTDEFVAHAEAHAGRSLRELFAAWLWTPALPR